VYTKSIDAKEARNDIISGMDYAQIMRKYNLSMKGLISLFDKMISSGAIGLAELGDKFPSADSPLVIRNQFTDGIIFSAKADSIRDLVELAISEGVDLSEADLTSANLAGLQGTRSILSGAMLFRANFNGADLSEADLVGAELSEARIANAILIGADLSNANLSQADARGANFSRARLFQTNLDNARLQKADFRDADLTESRIVGADVTDALFEGARLDNVLRDHVQSDRC
jgi:uncharacterized protein YjbI with pentapeptide repeats